MVRMLAFLAGMLFIAAGVACYGRLPQLISDDLLMGYFTADILHGLVYLVTGVVAILAGFKAGFSKLFFILIGAIYGVAAGWGYTYDGDIHFMQLSQMDIKLYAGIAVFSLLIGFNARSN